MEIAPHPAGPGWGAGFLPAENSHCLRGLAAAPSLTPEARLRLLTSAA
jgi:hypothetical protein